MYLNKKSNAIQRIPSMLLRNTHINQEYNKYFANVAYNLSRTNKKVPMS